MGREREGKDMSSRLYLKLRESTAIGQPPHQFGAGAPVREWVAEDRRPAASSPVPVSRRQKAGAVFWEEFTEEEVGRGREGRWGKIWSRN